MNFNRYRYSLVLLAVLFIADSVQANEVQLITSHKKNNGTLLRIVTSNRIKDLDNLAGWIGNENWFYVTLNNTRLSDKLGELIEYSSPVISLEVSENRESVQLGFLFERPLEDFEIFHSEATRVILVQVWESVGDSIRSEVQLSENQNENMVFSLPKKEAKGSPFYDSFIYARDKYGPEKYFVWYDKWFSTEDVVGDDLEADPQPVKVKKIQKSFIGPSLAEKKEKEPDQAAEKTLRLKITNILERGMLHHGINRPRDVKKLQQALTLLGYDLGTEGPDGDGIDGGFGDMTEDAVIQFQTDMGYSQENIDGIVGLYTLNGLISELKRVGVEIPEEKSYTVAPTKPRTRKQKDYKITKLPRDKQSAAQPKLTLHLPERETGRSYVKINSNLDGADVFMDGTYLGKTPIPKKLSVRPGWHRIRMVNPFGPPPQFVIAIPDYQDIFVSAGRTQTIRFKLFSAAPDSTI